MRSPRSENDFGPQPGEQLIFADSLAADCFGKAKLEFKRLRDVRSDELSVFVVAHPFEGLGGGYDFAVPLLDGDHVTDDAGTGFVHTAPGHGREDFDAWMAPQGSARGDRHRHSLHRRRCWLLHQGCAGLRSGSRGWGRARHRRQRQERRRQQGGHRRTDQAQHAVRARPPEAPVSAFVALEEAGHLPQHPAVVRLYGQGTRRIRHPGAAPTCAAAPSPPSMPHALCRRAARRDCAP